MTRFLKNRWAPVLLGFDPLLQLIHEDDVVKLLADSVLNDRPGAFNVAAEGVMPLRRVLALAGTFPLPVFHPLAYWGTQLIPGSGLELDDVVPLELDYLRYPWVGDITKMRDEMGFVPGYTAEEALREFAVRRQQPGRIPTEDSLAVDEEQLRVAIERRRRIKAQPASAAVKGDENE
jgi:UDP-glucose 4-epimerase